MTVKLCKRENKIRYHYIGMGQRWGQKKILVIFFNLSMQKTKILMNIIDFSFNLYNIHTVQNIS